MLVLAGGPAAASHPGADSAEDADIRTASYMPGPAIGSTALLRDAQTIGQEAAACGQRLSQRALARQLRDRGHRFPNEQLHQIAEGIGLTAARAA